LRENDELWQGFVFILKELDQEYYLHLRMKSEKYCFQKIYKCLFRWRMGSYPATVEKRRIRLLDALTPLEYLYEADRGENGREIPLPPILAALYGHLGFPARSQQPLVIGNFITTLDGVAAFNDTDLVGGGDIGGSNKQDRMVMGLLRAVADAVVIGAGTQRSVPKHRLAAQYIYPGLADVFQELRITMGKSEPPLNVIVTARGDLNLALPIFQSGEVPVLIVTNTHGEERIRQQRLSPSVQVISVHGSGLLSASDILNAIRLARQSEILLVEGGPQLMGNFLEERRLDELFLTLAPQVAGRDKFAQRPGLVAGKLFAPEHPLWGTLIGVKRGGSHLFLRYAF
jgi:riboflavin biosynthesis pyrimidine reductase